MLTVKMGRAALSLLVGTLGGAELLAQEAEFAGRLSEARHAVLSGAGKVFYEGAFSEAFDAQRDKRLKRLRECARQTEERTGVRTLDGVSFSMLLELGGDGRVESAMVWPELMIATCYVKQAKKDKFPRPPSAGFWVAVSIKLGRQQAVEVPVPAPTRPTRLLITSLSSEDLSVRSAAAWELAGATELQAEARAALEQLRTDEDRGVRHAVVWALGHLGPLSATATSETPPRPLKILRPEYPKAPFEAQIEGTVLVELLIGEQGEVAHLEIRKSIPELDAAAIACVRQWTFEPGRINGVPRATFAQAPVAFRIY
jgi:TonB family protein